MYTREFTIYRCVHFGCQPLSSAINLTTRPDCIAQKPRITKLPVPKKSHYIVSPDGRVRALLQHARQQSLAVVGSTGYECLLACHGGVVWWAEMWSFCLTTHLESHTPRLAANVTRWRIYVFKNVSRWPMSTPSNVWGWQWHVALSWGEMLVTRSISCKQ